jgi:hypothetical protein
MTSSSWSDQAQFCERLVRVGLSCVDLRQEAMESIVKYTLLFDFGSRSLPSVRLPISSDISATSWTKEAHIARPLINDKLMGHSGVAVAMEGSAVVFLCVWVRGVKISSKSDAIRFILRARSISM